jgi:HSP20 family protein
MTSMMRWEPFRELMSMRDMMDRAFGDAFLRSAGGLDLEGTLLLDLAQTSDDVIVRASLPGVKPDDIHISVTGDVLTLRGAVKEEKVTSEVSYHLRERRYGSFSRTITLPTSVVAEKAKAEFENGVLTLTIPKAEEHKPKSITVKPK